MRKKVLINSLRSNENRRLTYRSHAGGIKEVIRHEETGFIVDIGDSTQAAKYAIKLLSNPELYQKCNHKC